MSIEEVFQLDTFSCALREPITTSSIEALLNVFFLLGGQVLDELVLVTNQLVDVLGVRNLRV